MNEIAKGFAQTRQELFRETAIKMRVHEAIIEKDFWVCWILDVLFSSPMWSDKLIFKGGTSLSKVFSIIDRFSEDIDLVLDWRVLGYSADDPWLPASITKQGKFVESTNTKAIVYLADIMLPALEIEFAARLGKPLSMSQHDHVIEISYPKAFDNPAIIPKVLLEIGPLASWTPHGSFSISPYAATYFPNAFSMSQVQVVAVNAERTFWEKATILHQEANRPQEKPQPSRYSRHYYDIFCLAQSNFRKSAILQKELLSQVVEFKERFYRTPWANLTDGSKGKMKLVPPDFRLESLEEDYFQMRSMIFNPDPPDFSRILSELVGLENEING